MSRPGREQVEDALVVDAVVDARAVAPRFDETDPPEGREVLGRSSRVEPELGLEGADAPLSVPQQLEDPHSRRVTEHPEKRRLDLVGTSGRERHLQIVS